MDSLIYKGPTNDSVEPLEEVTNDEQGPVEPLEDDEVRFDLRKIRFNRPHRVTTPKKKTGT